MTDKRCWSDNVGGAALAVLTGSLGDKTFLLLVIITLTAVKVRKPKEDEGTAKSERARDDKDEEEKEIAFNVNPLRIYLAATFGMCLINMFSIIY